jgi:hypothetical protein
VDPFEEGHNNECPAVGFVDFVNGANVGMIACGGSLCLTKKTLSPFFVTQQMRRQKLQRYRTFEPSVFGLIDDAHPAFAKLLGDLVMRMV